MLYLLIQARVFRARRDSAAGFYILVVSTAADGSFRRIPKLSERVSRYEIVIIDKLYCVTTVFVACLINYGAIAS